MILREIRRRAGRFLGPTFSLCLVFYFAYHLIEGGRGVRAWRHLEKEVTVARLRLDDFQGEHDGLKQKVSLMRGSICPSLLEEEVRKLGYVRPNEIMVVH